MAANLQQIEDMFHRAMTVERWERADYLDEACQENNNLRREVDSLIAAYENSGGLLDETAVTLAMRVLSAEAVDSMVGQEVGPYKILSLLGQGGMGAVYLAENRRLNRKVALKFLSAEYVTDNWAKRQLIREAQAVARLDHPNICAVYDFEEIGEHSFIVMQYIEGQTLADLIRRKSLAASQLIPLSQQIGNALADAHAHGIIHRDIKPKNIMVTPSQQVKVLDFGLAKAVPVSEDVIESLSQLSQDGLLVGTVAYMSPEQLRGERLDFRTDIFSLGTVMYEMVTSKNPYARETNAETISAILTSKPSPLSEHGLQVPRELDRILQKCSEKDRKQRFYSINELLVELDNCADPVSERRAALLHPGLRLVASVAVILLLVAISFLLVKSVTRTRTTAILPIANETGDASLDYLGDGLTESIINKLSGLSKLRVKPLTVVAGYKRNGIDPKIIGRDLGVDSVLVSKITGTRDAPRLQTTLISVPDGSQLWSNEYQVGLSNVFSVEQDISHSVTAQLELWAKGDRERIRLVRTTDNPEAFHQYMLGKYYLANRNAENIKKAIDAFNAAIKFDPLYAQAWTGLADCYSLMNTTAYGEMPTAEAMSRARAAAKKALELDNSLAEAHTSLGVINLKYDWKWQEAESEFRNAISLRPDLATAHYWYSLLLTVTGRQAEAVAESRLAREFDPFSSVVRANLCREFYYGRDFDTAVNCVNQSLNEDPNDTHAKYLLGYVQVQRGAFDAAIQTFSGLPDTPAAYKLVAMGFAYGKAGRRAEALEMLSRLRDLAKQTYVPPMEFAVIYLGLGDDDNTLLWLNKACDERFLTIISLQVEPSFDHLRADPRFQELVRRVNLPTQPAG
jgi:serine/threonine-protein kinase